MVWVFYDDKYFRHTNTNWNRAVSISTASTIKDSSSNTTGTVPTSSEDKKRKMNDVYASGRWMDEDSYEVMKVRQVIRNHVFKNLRFVKGEGRKALTTNFEKKYAKILQYDKCHEKADLTKTNG